MRKMPWWNLFSRVYSGLPSFSLSLLKFLSVFKKTSRYLSSLILAWGSAHWLPGGAGLSLWQEGPSVPAGWLRSCHSLQSSRLGVVCATAMVAHSPCDMKTHIAQPEFEFLLLAAGVEGNTVPFLCAESWTILFSFALATSDRHFNYGRSVSYCWNISSSCSKLLVTYFLSSRDLLWSPTCLNSRGFPSATVFQLLFSTQSALFLCRC